MPVPSKRKRVERASTVEDKQTEDDSKRERQESTKIKGKRTRFAAAENDESESDDEAVERVSSYNSK